MLSPKISNFLENIVERSHLEAGSIRCDDGLDPKAVEVQSVTLWYRQVAGLCGEEPHLVLPNARWSFMLQNGGALVSMSVRC